MSLKHVFKHLFKAALFSRTEILVWNAALEMSSTGEWPRWHQTLIGGGTGIIVRLPCLEELSGYAYLVMNGFPKWKLGVEQPYNTKQNSRSRRQMLYFSHEKKKSRLNPLANFQPSLFMLSDPLERREDQTTLMSDPAGTFKVHLEDIKISTPKRKATCCAFGPVPLRIFKRPNTWHILERNMSTWCILLWPFTRWPEKLPALFDQGPEPGTMP